MSHLKHSWPPIFLNWLGDVNRIIKWLEDHVIACIRYRFKFFKKHIHVAPKTRSGSSWFCIRKGGRGRFVKPTGQWLSVPGLCPGRELIFGLLFSSAPLIIPSNLTPGTTVIFVPLLGQHFIVGAEACTVLKQSSLVKQKILHEIITSYKKTSNNFSSFYILSITCLYFFFCSFHHPSVNVMIGWVRDWPSQARPSSSNHLPIC